MRNKVKKHTRLSLILGLIAVLIVALLYFVPSLLQSYLTHELEEKGFADPSLSVDQMSAQQLTIQSVQLQKQPKTQKETENTTQISIPKIEVDYSPVSLLKGRVNDIVIPTLAIDTQSTDPSREQMPQNILINAVQNLGNTQHLEIDQATIYVSDPKNMTKNYKIVGHINMVNEHGHIKATGEVAISGMRFKYLFPGEPVFLSGPFTITDDSFHAQLKFADQNKLLTGTIYINQNTKNQTGVIDVDLQSVDFAKHRTDLRDIFANLQREFIFTHGNIHLGGRLKWTTDPKTEKAHMSMDPGLKLTGEHLTGHLADLEYRNLSTQMAMVHFNPLITKPQQPLTASMLKIGIHFTHVSGRYQIHPLTGENKSILDIETVTGKIADGLIQGQHIIYNPRASRHEINLLVRNVSVSKLINYSDVDGLSGKGNLHGHFPVIIDPSGVYIKNGILRSKGGEISYVPTAPELTKANENAITKLAFNIVDSFHFHDLIMHINYSPLNAELNMKFLGTNPELMDNHPVKFNVNLVAPLHDIFKSAEYIHEIEKRTGIKSNMKITIQKPVITGIDHW